MTNSLSNSCIAQYFSRGRVLVTGATGLIGARLCEILSAAGAEVHAISRSSNTQPAVQSVRMWTVDLCDAQGVQRLTREVGASFVFHLAGKVTAQQELTLVADTLATNLLGTVNILTALAGSKIEKFVLAGSSAEISGATQPSSPYAASKLASAIYADLFQRLYDVPVVRTRIFTTYGPRQEASKVVPHIITSLLAGQPPRLSSSTRACDFIFVDDVVTGLLNAGRSGQPGGDPIDLGTGQRTTLGDLAREVARLLGRPIEPVFDAAEARKFEAVTTANVAATCDLLAWRPAWTLEQGLIKTVEWFALNRLGGHCATHQSG